MKNHEADATGIRVRRTAITIPDPVDGIEPPTPPAPGPGAEVPSAGQDAPDATDPSFETES